MDEAALVGGGERAGDLQGEFQREARLQRAVALHERVEGFALDEFHRVEIRVVARLPEVIDGGDVRMPELRRRAGLAHEAPAGVFVLQVSCVNDFQRDRHAQVRVKRPVGRAHRARPECVQGAIGATEDFVMLKTQRFVVGGRHRGD